MSSRNHDQKTPEQPDPQEPADVDALLAESLKAQSERDFTWKEPDRRPRWWERAEAETSSGISGTRSPETAPSQRGAGGSHLRSERAVRPGSIIFSFVALALAGWVVVSVVFGVTVDPIVLGLVVCALAGLALVAAGLRPKPGTRL